MDKLDPNYIIEESASKLDDSYIIDESGPAGVKLDTSYIVSEQKPDLSYIVSEKKEEPDYIKAGLLGVKKSLIPFSTTKEELTRKHTLGETAAEVVGNMIADIGTGALIGAAATAITGPGSALGAVLGTGSKIVKHAPLLTDMALAVYRGVGNEITTATAQGRTFELSKALGEIAVELNPFIKYGAGGLAKVVKGTTQAAMTTAQAMVQGSELESALLSGAIRGTITGVVNPPRELNLKSIFSKADESLTVGVQATRGVKGTTAEYASMVDDMEKLTYTKVKDTLKNMDERSYIVNKELLETADTSEFVPVKLNIKGKTDAVMVKEIKNTYGVDIEFTYEGKASSFNNMTRMIIDAKDKPREVIEKEIGSFLDTRNRMLIEWMIGSNKNKASLSKGDIKKFSKVVTEAKGEEGLQIAVKAFVNSRVIIDEVGKQVKEDLLTLGDIKDFGWWDNFMDAFVVGEVMDKYTKGVTNFRATVETMAEATNRINSVAKPLLDKYKKVLEDLQKNKIDTKDIFQYTKTLNVLPENQQVAMEGLKNFWNEAMDELNNRGAKISEWSREKHIEKMYTHHTAASNAEIASRMRIRLKDISDKYTNKSLPELAKIASDSKTAKELDRDTREFFRVYRRYFKTKTYDGIPRDSQDALNHINDIINLDLAKKRTALESSSSFRRKDVLQPIELETDLSKIVPKYLMSQLSSIYYEAPLNMAKVNLEVIRGIGAMRGKPLTEMENFVSTWILDAAGRVKGLPAILNKASQKMQQIGYQMMEDSESYFGKKAGAAIKELPNVISYMVNNVQSNVLGYFNISSSVANAAQPVVMTVPEIGPTYGMSLLARGAKYALQKTSELKKAGSSMEKDLIAKGLMSDASTRQAAALIQSSIIDSYKATKFAHMMEAIAEFSMTAYKFMDLSNRSLTVGVAETLFKDIRNKVPKALAYLKTLPDDIQFDVLRNNKSDSLVSFLNAKTQFLYDKGSLSNYARYAGGQFTMFTKWPIMISSDVYKLLALEKNYGKFMTKYVAPLAVLEAAGITLDQMDMIEDPTIKTAFGNGIASITKLAPITAPFGLVRANPVIDMASKTIVATGDTLFGRAADTGWKSLKDAYKAMWKFIPFTGVATSGIELLEKTGVVDK